MKSKPLTLKSGLTAILAVVLFAFASFGALLIPSAKADEPTADASPVFINLKDGDLDIDYDDPKIPMTTRLWQVESAGKTSQLLNGKDIVYATKDADDRVAAVVGGDDDHPANDSFVAYTGSEIEVKLNPAYIVNVQTVETEDYGTVEGKEYTIAELTELADSVTYRTVSLNDEEPADEENLFDGIGKPYVINSLLTEVVFDFGENAVLNQEDNEIGTSSTKLVVKKYWNIVTINNVLRSYDDDTFGAPVYSVELGYAAPATELTSPRPEHGDTVVWTIYELSEDISEEEPDRPNETVVVKFAVKFEVVGDTVTEVIYTVGDDNTLGAVDTEHTYFGSFFEDITPVTSGRHYLEGYVPEVTLAADETAWWGDDLDYTSGTQFAAFTQRLSIVVKPLDIATAVEQKLVNVSIAGEILYNGELGADPYDNATVVFAKDGVITELERGIDYELAFSNNVNVGNAAVLIVVGMSNFTGEYSTTFTIVQAENDWATAPNFSGWRFGSFDRSTDLFRAVPKFGSATDVKFMIYTDRECTKVVESLPEGFTVNEAGGVDDATYAELNKLSRGAYYVACTVAGTANYKVLEMKGLVLKVEQSSNGWVVAPTINAWTEGKYDETENAVNVQALFGDDTVVVYVYNIDGEVVYESTGGKIRTNELSSLKHGFYTLMAHVDGTSDYSEITGYVNFQVFEKPGLPWWGTLLIVIGSLAIVAIVLLILKFTGVLTLLTGKVALSIKTQATVDATLAAVRANKRAEEAKASVAAAKAREAKAARRAAAAAERAKPAEEKAAALEAKAKAQAERAERMRARAEAMQARAERLREQAQAQTTEAPAEREASESQAAEAAATDDTNTASED